VRRFLPGPCCMKTMPLKAVLVIVGSAVSAQTSTCDPLTQWGTPLRVTAYERS
jgi:hypothetical protein